MPATPELVTPADGVVARLESMLFSWQAVTGGADLYTLQIATDAAFANIVFQIETTLTQMEGVFEAGNLYYWRVRAKIGGSTVTSTEVRDFSAPALTPYQIDTHVEDGKGRVLNQFQEGA